MGINRIVFSMAVIRTIFGVMGLIGAFIMIKSNNAETALKVNGVLGAIGPFIMLSVSALGLIELASKIPYEKIAMIVIGVILILLGTK